MTDNDRDINWRPIADAPRDGTIVLVWFPDMQTLEKCMWQEASGTDDASWTDEGRMWTPECSPTHFAYITDPNGNRIIENDGC